MGVKRPIRSFASFSDYPSAENLLLTPAHIAVWTTFSFCLCGLRYTVLWFLPFYGPGIKVAYDTHGDVTAADRIDRILDTEKQNQLQAWLESIMPVANLVFVGGATCMYTLTPDLDFLIGPHPPNPNLLIGTGFSEHGFTFFDTQ